MMRSLGGDQRGRRRGATPDADGPLGQGHPRSLSTREDDSESTPFPVRPGPKLVAIRTQPRYTHGGQGVDHESGERTDQGFYVQVRYPAGKRWVAVAASLDRRNAIQLGARAYRHLEDERGRTANSVRVISVGDLEAEGGIEAVSLAACDVWAHRLDT